jgi:phage gp36-like protein
VSYVTQQDLIDRFGSAEILALADRDGDAEIDAAVVTAAVGDAESEIAGYLAKRYTLPLAAVPDRLKRVAADLARLFLHVNDPPEYVTKAADDGRRWLRDIANGLVELGVTPPPTAAAGAKVEGPARVFSSTTLKGFG